MKATIKNTIALTCAALGLLGASNAEAASFKLETLVPGYSSFAVVKPELRYILGGRVRWNAAIGSYETDRVSRGERLRITLRPSTSGERCNNLGIMGIIANRDVANISVGYMPFSTSNYYVTRNTAHDNVKVGAVTTSGYFEVRLPIGTR